MTTTNKNLNQPAYNSTGWDVSLNNNFANLDGALGSTTTINVTGLSGTTTFVSTFPASNPPYSYITPQYILTGTLTANLTFQFPSGIGGTWVIYNNTSGNYTVTFSSAGAGTSVLCSQGYVTSVWSDGTNIRQTTSIPTEPITVPNLAFGSWTTVASASTVDLGAQTLTRNIVISGTTTIASFGSTATPDNIPFQVYFSGALTLTNSSSLILPSNASITTAAGDSMTVAQISTGVWKVLSYTTASGLPLVTAPVYTYGVASANHLKITNDSGTPNTKIDVTADFMSLANSSNALIVFSSISIVIDLTTTGANGMDTGSRPASGLVYIWGISNGSTVAAVASLSSTSPTLPSGYTYKIRLGTARTDGSQNLFRFLQAGNRWEYVLTASTNTTSYPSFSASGSISSVVPTTASQVIGITTGISGSEFGPNNLSYQAYSLYNAGNAQIVQATFLIQNNSIAVNYSVYIVGWIDSINAS